MIPATGARARAPFPYVGLAAVVLLIHAILVAVVPANPYRAAIAFAALFAVGYCTLALTVRDTIRLTAAHNTPAACQPNMAEIEPWLARRSKRRSGGGPAPTPIFPTIVTPFGGSML